jgi:hypothetical protein
MYVVSRRALTSTWGHLPYQVWTTSHIHIGKSELGTWEWNFYDGETIQIQSPSLQPVDKDHERLNIQERRLLLVKVTWKVKFLLKKKPRET